MSLFTIFILKKHRILDTSSTSFVRFTRITSTTPYSEYSLVVLRPKHNCSFFSVIGLQITIAEFLLQLPFLVTFLLRTTLECDLSAPLLIHSPVLNLTY